MKSDSVLSKTAKGLAAAQNAAGLSVHAATLLAAIDGRRDMKSLKRKSGGLTARDVEGVVEELLQGGYVQVLGAPTVLPDEDALEDQALLMSLDFSALRTQALNKAAEVAKANEILNAEQDRRAAEVEGTGAPADSAREAHSRLEAEIRATLIKDLRPRVEEALRVKLRPKIADELRRAFAAALRPRLEAAVRAQLEAELKPRVELELRARFARQIADMTSQVRNRTDDATAPDEVHAEVVIPGDDGAARLLASLSEVVFATDALGALTQVNAAWTQLSGHHQSDAPGKALAEFFADSERRGVEAFLRRVAQGTAIRFVHEAQLERADGETLWVELRAAPLALASGEPGGVCGVMREISEARRVAGELQDVGLELLLLVDESDAGVLIEDAEGTIKQVNPAFCAMFGVQAAPFSLEGSASAELIQQIGPVFADVDDLLSRMARIRAAAEDADGCDVVLAGGGLARLSYRTVAEDGPPRGHLWIFRVALTPVAPALESLP